VVEHMRCKEAYNELKLIQIILEIILKNKYVENIFLEILKLF
jgi:hypothetical protein